MTKERIILLLAHTNPWATEDLMACDAAGAPDEFWCNLAEAGMRGPEIHQGFVAAGGATGFIEAFTAATETKAVRDCHAAVNGWRDKNPRETSALLPFEGKHVLAAFDDRIEQSGVKQARRTMKPAAIHAKVKKGR